MSKQMIRKERIMLMVEQFNKMNPGDHLNRSILLGTLVHTQDKDKAEAPYIEHIMRVVTGCKTYEGKVVAGIHDVIEDHPEFTLDDLLLMGFTDYQIKGVDNITKRPGENKEQYYARVMRQENSLDAKLSDLKDNSSLERLTIVTEKDKKRTEGYLNAINLLSTKFNPNL